jgi:hypothetical protein
MSSAPFTSPQAAALALLNAGVDLTSKQGQFLGGVAFMEGPLSVKQSDWLIGLLKKHGLPRLQGGGE